MPKSVGRSRGSRMAIAAGGLSAPRPSRKRRLVAVDTDDIGGVVTSSDGPEAGVWVIAETDDLPTKFRKIVVTDDHGRYCCPICRRHVHAVGAGLRARRFAARALDAGPRRRVAGRRCARCARGRADLSGQLLVFADRDTARRRSFRARVRPATASSPGWRAQHHWINQIKTSCNVCHQLGNLATREFPPALGHVRIVVRRVGSPHAGRAGRHGDDPAINALGRRVGSDDVRRLDGSHRRGEVPPEAPPRPQGIERNLVLTLWEWGGPATFAHDELSTDKRNPTGERERADLRRRLGQ